MIKNWFQNIGPGTLVAAAFIGPGTVTLCTLAGVNFGMNLLWAMGLSIITTIVLQEMAARLGLVSQKGLSEVIRGEIKNPFFKKAITLLILSAIVIGNASYEAGNISGGILGIETICGPLTIPLANLSLNFWSLIIGGIAFTLLYFGNYRFLEKTLIALVVIMSFSFLITAFITGPDPLEVLKDLFIPKFPEKSILTIVGIIGTTVVPYNLFLHAALVKEKWKNSKALPLAKKDTVISIVLGGLVSMAIMISAATIPTQEINNAADLAKSLEPLYGSFAKYFMALGLFAAGITSAITAPLAAAYVVKGCLGWKGNQKAWSFRGVWIFILLVGVFFSSLRISPIEIIKFAQIANGILLPVIAGILLWIMNKKNVLGSFRNTLFQNILSVIILGISIFLGLKSILTVFSLL